MSMLSQSPNGATGATSGPRRGCGRTRPVRVAAGLMIVALDLAIVFLADATIGLALAWLERGLFGWLVPLPKSEPGPDLLR
jgi:hypothetical protein